MLLFSLPFKLKGSPITTPDTLYSLKIENNFSISFMIFFLFKVIIGVAIVLVLSQMAMPIVLSPKSRPDSICNVLN